MSGTWAPIVIAHRALMRARDELRLALVNITDDALRARLGASLALLRDDIREAEAQRRGRARNALRARRRVSGQRKRDAESVLVREAVARMEAAVHAVIPGRWAA